MRAPPSKALGPSGLSSMLHHVKVVRHVYCPDRAAGPGGNRGTGRGERPEERGPRAGTGGRRVNAG